MQVPDNPKIQIHQQNTSIAMTEKPYPAPKGNQKVIDAQGGFNASKNVRLLMRPEATARLLGSTSWGSQPRQQDVEQAGVLVGKYYKDISRRQPVIWGDVITIIPFDPSLVQASQTRIAIPQSAWARMLDEFVLHLNNGYLNLGWYHTHLDFTNTRFTTVDKDTQQRYYTGEHSFAVVLNPNQKQWSVYYGPRADECVGELFLTEEVFEQFREPKITIQDVRGDSRLNQDGTITHLNLDGTPVVPSLPASMLMTEKSFISLIGEKLFGKQVQRSNRQVASPKRPGFSTNDIGNNTNEAHRTTRSQHPSVENRSQSVQQPASRIIVQETTKPKITFLPKENQHETRRVVKATVFVVSANDSLHQQQQNPEGLQIIEQNIIEVVDSIIRCNVNTSLSLSNPVNAHLTLNNDLTLEVRLCEAKSNAIVRVSTQPFEIAFPKEIIDLQVIGVAEIIKRQQSEPSYLLYISETSGSISLNVFQIKKEAIK